jgi:hypothetical protein
MSGVDARTNDVAALQADMANEVARFFRGCSEAPSNPIECGACTADFIATLSSIAISAIRSLRAELTELRLELIATSGQAGEHHAARVAAEAEVSRQLGAVFGLANELSWNPKTREIAERIRAALTPNTGTPS